MGGAGLVGVGDAAGFALANLLVLVEVASPAALDGKSVAGEPGFENRPAAVQRDVELGELAELGGFGSGVAAEEREEIADSAV